MDKNFLKKHSSKVIFLIIGICISLTVYSVRAAWNSTVTTQQTLTTNLWNDMVAKLQNLESRTSNLESVPADVIPCAWDGNRTICGDCSDCHDDVVITCSGGIVTNIKMSCGN